jgi:hypothetical protein
VIDCCVILHNLLIETGDEIPDDWIEDDSDSGSDCGSDVGYEVGEYNMINDDDRRERCIEYFINMGLLHE